VPALADDAETLELGLIENIQRKDLTPFEEADGLHRLSTQFEYTHEDIAKKIGRARSSVTETLSLRNIPDSLRRKCVDHGINSKSLLLQIARQPAEKKMVEMFHRILQGGLTRDEARRERRQQQAGPQRPRPFIFQFEPPSETFRFRIQEKPRFPGRADLDAARNPGAARREFLRGRYRCLAASHLESCCDAFDPCHTEG